LRYNLYGPGLTAEVHIPVWPVIPLAATFVAVVAEVALVAVVAFPVIFIAQFPLAPDPALVGTSKTVLKLAGV